MGSSGSKHDSQAPLLLCKDRIRYIKQAIDSRYALSAAHLAYTQSLRDLGIALRRFAEAEVLADSSQSASEPDKTPSHSSYASPSPSRIPEHVGSPLHSGGPISPRRSDASYMRATGSASVKVTVDSSSTHFVEEDSLTFPPPPPPPLPEIGSSWDFFDPIDTIQQNSRLPQSENGPSPSFSRLTGSRQSKEEAIVPLIEDEEASSRRNEDSKWSSNVNSRGNNGSYPYVAVHSNAGGRKMMAHPYSINGGSSVEKSPDLSQTEICEGGGTTKSECRNVSGSAEALVRIASSEICGSKNEKAELEKELCTEREDASEFITHRAKDFLSSIKDIEHRFTRAAESCHEVSRMLETNKIRLGNCSEAIGNSSVSVFLSAFHLVCCRTENVPEHDAARHVTKVITWNRSISSRSSSSRNPLTSASKDDNGESGSDFIEEFCMISGSHSSTLDRLYAWERKLCDEVKASVYIRKVYDQKCTQLRHQFAKDQSARVIDKTRAVVKDLHSQVMVTIQAVDSISRRIEKLRDDEVKPQLLELIQGLIRMWRAMLQSHHAQYITISLAYHVRSSAAVPKGESYNQALTHLRAEMDSFGCSFANWVDAHRSYIEALNTWLQKCIMQPNGRSRGRKAAFSPRRALAPPIFVLCRDWLEGLNSLPSEEVRSSVEGVVAGLRDSLEQLMEEKPTEKRDEDVEDDGETVRKENEEDEKGGRVSNLGHLQTSLTRAFDRLAKFAEASLKMYEDVKQGAETACAAYTNGRIRSTFQDHANLLSVGFRRPEPTTTKCPSALIATKPM